MSEQRPLNLWDLKRGDTFVFDDDPKVELVYIGMDGMYAKVRALDPEINKAMCARYDARSDFFAVMSWGAVTKVVPECFKVEKVEDQAGRIDSFVIVPKPK